MEQYIIGIDVGKAGGIAVIDVCSEELILYDTYDLENYKNIFRKYKGKLYVEQVHSMPHDGKKQAFSFGKGYGLILGMAYCTNHELIEISPQKWKNYFNLDNDKAKSIKLAKKYYPLIDLNIGKRKIIESDGMAEAILIARYGMEAENE